MRKEYENKGCCHTGKKEEYKNKGEVRAAQDRIADMQDGDLYLRDASGREGSKKEAATLSLMEYFADH